MKTPGKKLRRTLALLVTLVLLGGMLCINTWAAPVDMLRFDFVVMPERAGEKFPTDVVGRRDDNHYTEIVSLKWERNGTLYGEGTTVVAGTYTVTITLQDLGTYLNGITSGSSQVIYIQLGGRGAWWDCTAANTSGRQYTFVKQFDMKEKCTHPNKQNMVIDYEEPTCVNDGHEQWGIACPDCGEVFSEGEYVTLPALEHMYDGEVAFSWAKDGKSCRASAECYECTHVETKACKVTYKVTKKPTANTAGKAVATASVVFNSSTYTDKKTITLPALSQLKKGSRGWGVYFTSNGKLNTTAKGLYKDASTGKWYLINKGLHDKKFIGVAKSAVNGKYYYAKGGTYYKKYSGLAKSLDNGKWYYVSNGALNWDYTGLVKYGGKWHSVKKGAKVLFTGVVKNHANGAWYYCYKGIYTPNYTGLARSITNGKLYYVYKGRVNWNYSGKVKYGGKTYIVVKGVAK